MIVRLFAEIELDDKVVGEFVEVEGKMDRPSWERELAKGLARQTQLGIESFSGVREARVVSIPHMLTGNKVVVPSNPFPPKA